LEPERAVEIGDGGDTFGELADGVVERRGVGLRGYGGSGKSEQQRERKEKMEEQGTVQ
jgi:hypothetical protein